MVGVSMRIFDRGQRSAPISPRRSKPRKVVNWAVDNQTKEATQDDDPKRPKALSIAAEPDGEIEALAAEWSGAVKGKLEVLHRSHIEALQRQMGPGEDTEALRAENMALRKENKKLQQENVVLRQEFADALQDNRAWCEENRVLQEQYTQAFLDKTSEVFQKTLALEKERDALAADHEKLRKACEDASKMHTEAERRNRAWQHENKILHEEYREHLEQSVDLLRNNVALKQQIAASNQEFTRVTASNKAFIKELMEKVGQALHSDGTSSSRGRGEDDAGVFSGAAASASSAGFLSPRASISSSKQSIDTFVGHWGGGGAVDPPPPARFLQPESVSPRGRVSSREEVAAPSEQEQVVQTPRPSSEQRGAEASLEVHVDLSKKGSVDTIVGGWTTAVKDGDVSQQQQQLQEEQDEEPVRESEQAAGEVSEGVPPQTSDVVTAVAQNKTQSWKRLNRDWLENTKTWQHSGRVLKRAMSTGGVDVEHEGRSFASFPTTKTRALVLPTRLTLKMENRAFRVGYLDAVLASRSSPRPTMAMTDDDFSDGSTDEEF